MTVSKRVAGQDHVDEVQHRIALLEPGHPKWPARLTGRTNALDGRRKQIQLQYAGIGGSYGWS
jgi:hypothetical protein